MYEFLVMLNYKEEVSGNIVFDDEKLDFFFII